MAATGLKQSDIDTFLTGLAAIIEPVVVDYNWQPFLPDPDDDMIANCAINGMADCILTNNVRDLRLVEERFGIRVLNAHDFIKQVDATLRTATGREELI